MQLFAAFFERTTVYHASELLFIFGPVPATVEGEFADQMTEYWINFVHDMNPGRASVWHSSCKFTPSSFFPANWPQYDVSSRYVMQLMQNNITLIPDSKSYPLVVMFAAPPSRDQARLIELLCRLQHRQD